MLKLTRSTDERSGSDRRRTGKTLAILAALGAGRVTVAYMLVLIILGLDVLVPLGTEVSLLYLIPLGFVAMWSSPKQSTHVLVIAAVCAVLTWVGFFLTPPHAVWSAVANRLLAVTVIGFPSCFPFCGSGLKTTCRFSMGYCRSAPIARRFGTTGGLGSRWSDTSRIDLKRISVMACVRTAGRSIFRTYSVIHARQPCRVRRDKTDLLLHP